MSPPVVQQFRYQVRCTARVIRCMRRNLVQIHCFFFIEIQKVSLRKKLSVVWRSEVDGRDVERDGKVKSPLVEV
jgi:hypothetical protein